MTENHERTNAMANMDLWDAVAETNPKITKHVNQRGGFTAICAQAQKKVATELWGSYGSTWGLTDLIWGEVHKGNEVAELTLEAYFKYPDGLFPISSDIQWKVGDDCRKKLQTDVLTKALSMLGFNSDVFEGRFDDNKYLQDQVRKFAKAPTYKTVRDFLADPKTTSAQLADALPRLAVNLQNEAIVKTQYAELYTEILIRLNNWDLAAEAMDNRPLTEEAKRRLAELTEVLKTVVCDQPQPPLAS